MRLLLSYLKEIFTRLCKHLNIRKQGGSVIALLIAVCFFVTSINYNTTYVFASRRLSVSKKNVVIVVGKKMSIKYTSPSKIKVTSAKKNIAKAKIKRKFIVITALKSGKTFIKLKWKKKICRIKVTVYKKSLTDNKTTVTAQPNKITTANPVIHACIPNDPDIHGNCFQITSPPMTATKNPACSGNTEMPSTAQPGSTCAPIKTSGPTHTPRPSCTPTVNPNQTQAPDITVGPVPSDEPDITSQPESTATPDDMKGTENKDLINQEDYMNHHEELTRLTDMHENVESNELAENPEESDINHLSEQQEKLDTNDLSEQPEEPDINDLSEQPEEPDINDVSEQPGVSGNKEFSEPPGVTDINELSNSPGVIDDICLNTAMKQSEFEQQDDVS